MQVNLMGHIIFNGSVYSLSLLPVLLFVHDSINSFLNVDFFFSNVRLGQEHTVMCTKLKIC